MNTFIDIVNVVGPIIGYIEIAVAVISVGILMLVIQVPNR